LGKNRNRLSIGAAILEAANPVSSKTNIMFRANLSFSLLEKYLDIATEAGFIRYEDSKYKLTEHGKEFLSKCKQFEGRYQKAEKMLDALMIERERLTRFCTESKLLQVIKQ